jgi:hypothetical protein
MSLADDARGLSPKAYGRAARIYDRALSVVSRPGDVPQAELDDANAAMDVLEAAFPGIEEIAEVGPEEWTDSHRSPRQQTRSPRKPKRRPDGSPESSRPRGDRPGRSSSRSGRRRRGRRRSGGRAGAFATGFMFGRAHPAVEATGLPGTARSITGTVLYAIGGIVGLTVLYDVLTAGRTPALFLQGIGGLGRGARRSADADRRIGGGPEGFGAVERRAGRLGGWPAGADRPFAARRLERVAVAGAPHGAAHRRAAGAPVAAGRPRGHCHSATRLRRLRRCAASRKSSCRSCWS